MWKNIKNLTDNNKQTPPRVLAEGGKLITSIKQICNIANKHYINKITNIRIKFTNNILVNPIQILNKLIKRNSQEIKINYATIEQVALIIKKAKNSNSHGSDIITMKIVKKLSRL